jgi:catechol 2,3-dioxygenase-like lactoylglutathione lyase family enzyme
MKRRERFDRSANIGEEIAMFSHVMIGTNDLEKAKSFYDVLLGTLGVPPGRVDRHRIFYRTPIGVFSVSKPIDGKPATPANGGTIGFAANSAEQADAFHAAGIANGGSTCEEPPGVREGSGVKLYIAYLRDPDGNKLCALHRIVDPKKSK